MDWETWSLVSSIMMNLFHVHSSWYLWGHTSISAGPCPPMSTAIEVQWGALFHVDCISHVQVIFFVERRCYPCPCHPLLHVASITHVKVIISVGRRRYPCHVATATRHRCFVFQEPLPEQQSGLLIGHEGLEGWRRSSVLRRHGCHSPEVRNRPRCAFRGLCHGPECRAFKQNCQEHGGT